MFCCALLCAHSNFAIILMGKRELVDLFSLSSWCLVIFVWLFLAVPRVCLQFVIVVFPDHTHLVFLKTQNLIKNYHYSISSKFRPPYAKTNRYKTFAHAMDYFSYKPVGSDFYFSRPLHTFQLCSFSVSRHVTTKIIALSISIS